MELKESDFYTPHFNYKLQPHNAQLINCFDYDNCLNAHGFDDCKSINTFLIAEIVLDKSLR
jgi:hypothetical protein